jgi:amidase
MAWPLSRRGVAAVFLPLLLSFTSTGLLARQGAAASEFRLEEATIADIHGAFDAGALTCRRLVELYLNRIKAYEDAGPRLNSITTINPQALEAADALDAARRAGKGNEPLHCIPILLKDNIDTADMPTSNGSVILKNARPPDDAHIVKALREAGALILGKAAMGEFAGGSYNTIDGQTKNPYDFSRDTGGSSSGSGASVSANFTVLAIGTDTSTSVRGPSSFTGIVGLRPTTGLISRDGIAPKNLNFDTAGPMARTVTDMVRLLNVIAGADSADPRSVEVNKHYPAGRTDFTQFLKRGALKGARLGVARDFFGGDPDIDRLAEAALAKMRELGAELVEVKLDPDFLEFHARRAGPNIRTPADYRFKKDWEAYLATFGPNVPKTVKDFIRIYETEVNKSPLPVEDSVLDLLKRGEATSTDDPVYKNLIENVLPRATKLKLAIFEQHKIDALVFPYQSSFANRIRNRSQPAAAAGRNAGAPRGEDGPSGPPNPATLAGYGSVGFPGIVVPMGFGSAGLPMTISFMGKPYEEAKLIGFAYDYEQASRMRRPAPKLAPLPGEVIPLKRSNENGAQAPRVGAAMQPSSAPAGNARDFVPVTTEMLLEPSPDDWPMLSRTYDEQRFSPLEKVNRGNVSQLQMAWVRGLPAGTQETTPIVYRGVMYVVAPGAIVQALDAATGDLIWEYQRKLFPQGLKGGSSDAERRAKALATTAKTKALAIYDDLIFYTAPDGYLAALDARTGALRWETKTHDFEAGVQHTSAPIVVDGKVITGRACGDWENCFIAAHDARTGKEVWKFHTAAAPGEPGGDSWGDVPREKRNASTWGLPGSYDPVRRLIYWGIANPRPYPRLTRHGGADAIPRTAPADLYSNSTVALHADTGKLAWHYQHLPGDDWDADHTHERVLLRTRLDPDAGAVKWINPKVPRGQPRDISVSVGEPGGIWALDRATGQFLWATPFPFDVPEFHISHIDVETGRTHINWNNVMKKDGDTIRTCFHNTKSYWATAYHPGTNSLYVPYADICLEMTAKVDSPQGYDLRDGRRRPGSDPQKFAGLAKIDMATGRIDRFYQAAVPGNGSILTTAGGLVFWGDLDRRFRAFDAENGRILWEAVLGGVIQTSTITYAVNGRQYVAVLTGDGQSGTAGLREILPALTTPQHNAIYVFALP